MPLFMMYSFVACGCMLALQLMLNNPRIAVKPLHLAAALLPVGVIICVVLRMCTHVLGGPQDILLLFSVLFPAGLVALGVSGMNRNGQRVSRVMAALLAVSLIAIGYMTLFSRDGTNSSIRIYFGLYKIKEAITTGSVQPLGHVFLNFVLFLPYGFFLSACCPGRSDKWLYLLASSFILTLSVESIQYVLRLGECDLEDVVANVAGAIGGFGGYKLFLKTK